MNKKYIIGFIFVISCILFVLCGMLIDNIRLTSRNYDFGVGLGFMMCFFTITVIYLLDILIPTKPKKKENEL